MGGKNKESNKAYVRNNEWKFQMSPSHPQLKKGIYMLNIVVQNLLEKIRVKEKDPKAMPKTLMPLAWVQKLDGSENLEGNFEGDQVAPLRG